MARPPKIKDVETLVKEAAKGGTYSATLHAKRRMDERDINAMQLRKVLVSGVHEAAKDEFDEDHKNWKYAIRSNDIDGKRLRVVVVIREGKPPQGGMLVVTAIDLDR